WRVSEGAEGIAKAIERICAQASAAIEKRINIIVLSDRSMGPERVAIPALLAVASVHHHLVREGTRLRAGIILESGEPREVHHFATLIAYGASAVNPYVMLETLDELVVEGTLEAPSRNGSANGARAQRTAEQLDEQLEQAAQNVVKALGKALLKTISKMGISTIQSYCGA